MNKQIKNRFCTMLENSYKQNIRKHVTSVFSISSAGVTSNTRCLLGYDSSWELLADDVSSVITTQIHYWWIDETCHSIKLPPYSHSIAWFCSKNWDYKILKTTKISEWLVLNDNFILIHDSKSLSQTSDPLSN